MEELLKEKEMLQGAIVEQRAKVDKLKATVFKGHFSYDLEHEFTSETRNLNLMRSRLQQLNRRIRVAKCKRDNHRYVFQ